VGEGHPLSKRKKLLCSLHGKEREKEEGKFRVGGDCVPKSGVASAEGGGEKGWVDIAEGREENEDVLQPLRR